MKKKTLSIALVVALCAIAVTGMSLAYFQDSDSAANTFTVGSVDIKLDEAAVIKRTTRGRPRMTACRQTRTRLCTLAQCCPKTPR